MRIRLSLPFLRPAVWHPAQKRLNQRYETSQSPVAVKTCRAEKSAVSVPKTKQNKIQEALSGCYDYSGFVLTRSIKESLPLKQTKRP